MKKKKGCAVKKYEMGGLNIGPMPIADFMALDPAAQQTYLDSLSPAERAKMLAASAMNINSPNRSNAPIVSKNPVQPSERMDPEAGIKSIQPNPIDPASPGMKDNVNKLKNSLTTLAGISGTFMDMANMSDPSNTEVGTGAAAGALQGIAGGAPLGLPGMIGGAVFGSITGALKSGTQREAFEQQEENRKKNLLTGLRVAPTMREDGGMVINDTVPERPAQMEKGEVMLFEDGRIVDVMAKKTHDEMKEKEVTDIIPTAFIFSNSDKQMIDLAKIADHIFNITKGHYSEDGNTPMEVITMGDTYGKKGKKTPAELAKMVKKQTPIIEKPRDEFERRTNIENLKRRAELLQPIMRMQEGTYEEFEFEAPEKYELGGISCPPGYEKDEEGRCFATNPDTGEITYYGGPLNEVTVTDTGRKPFNPALPLGSAMPKPTVNAALGAIGAYRRAKNPIVAPLPGAEMNGVSEPAAEQPPVNVATESSRLFPLYENVLSKNDKRISDDYLASVNNAENLYQSQRFSNLGVLATRLAGIGAQNPTVTPTVQGTEHINSMFPEVSEYAVDSQVQGVRKGQNRVLQAINDSGISGTDVGSSIASTQSRLIDAESNLRANANAKNLSQKALKAQELQRVLNSNRASEVSAENQTRSNRNRLISGIAGAGGEFINANSGLKQSLNERLEELKKWRQESTDRNEQKKLDLEIKRLETKWKTEDRALDKKYIDEAIAKFADSFTINRVKPATIPG